MVRLCAEEGIKELTIVCSDIVKDFYLRMGAEFLGRVESTVDKGTTVARLRYRSSRRHE